MSAALHLLARCAAWTAVAYLFDVALGLAIRARPIWLRPLLPWCAFILVAQSTHSPLVAWSAAAIYLFYDQFPWGRWRKKLGAKLSSLTDATRAALKREQAEAFS